MAEVQVIPPKAARPDTLRVAAYELDFAKLEQVKSGM